MYNRYPFCLPRFSVVTTSASAASPQPFLVCAVMRNTYTDSGFRPVTVYWRALGFSTSTVAVLPLVELRWYVI